MLHSTQEVRSQYDVELEKGGILADDEIKAYLNGDIFIYSPESEKVQSKDFGIVKLPWIIKVFYIQACLKV